MARTNHHESPTASTFPDAQQVHGLDDIRRRAYERFLERGATHGHDVEDWLAAEQEMASLAAPVEPHVRTRPDRPSLVSRRNKARPSSAARA